MNYGPASKYYDLFASKDDIEFYKELAIKLGRKALELGVGTGRVAIPLARAEVAVWGIDNSKYMLDVARQKLQKESSEVRRRLTFEIGDMRSFRLEEIFPFVYIASSTFEHCTTEKDQRECLTSVYQSLQRNGVLAFDISQPRPDKPESSWWIDRAKLSEEEEVVRTIFSRRNVQTGVVSVNLFFDVYRNGVLTERYYEHGEARVCNRESVEKMLESIGLKVNKVYGDFDKSECIQDSERAILVAVKP